MTQKAGDRSPAFFAFREFLHLSKQGTALAQRTLNSTDRETPIEKIGERPMKRILLAGLLSAGAAFGAYAQTDPEQGAVKLSAAECTSLWNQASPDGSPITESQAAAYVTDFKAANPDGDKTLEKAEFSKACNNGLVKSGASSGASSGESGTAPTEKYK